MESPSRLLKPRVGYTDLQHEPEDGRRYEIYDGEVFVVPSPLPRHQIVVCNLAEILRAYARNAGGLVLVSPIDIVFAEYNVLMPDVVLFNASQLAGLNADAPIRVTPALVTEVLSPSTESRDRGRKLQLYARFAVPEYWIVDPVGRTIEVSQLAGGGYTRVQSPGEEDELISPTLASLRFPVESIFAMPI